MALLNARDLKRLVKDVDALVQRAIESPDITFATEEAAAMLQALQLKLPSEVGGVDSSRAWADLTDTERSDLTAQLQALRASLEGITEPSYLMSPRLAPTWAIALLLALSVAAIGGALFQIHSRWSVSMPDEMASADRQAAHAALQQHAEQLTRERVSLQAQIETRNTELSRLEGNRDAAAKATPLDKVAIDGLDVEIAAARKGVAAAKAEIDAVVQREAQWWRQASEAEASMKPKGLDVLLMVILFGALGGCLHLASSLTMYIGNRDFKRSWIAYYLMAPLQGAALAPLIFLLLRSAILSPQAAGDTGALNLTAIYAFSGLTGLFAKQAIERLAAVFVAMFTKIDARDQTKPAAGAGT
jgi:hypothetical protein